LFLVVGLFLAVPSIHDATVETQAKPLHIGLVVVATLQPHLNILLLLVGQTGTLMENSVVVVVQAVTEQMLLVNCLVARLQRNPHLALPLVLLIQ
jgi:hypothetical protein